MTRPALYAGGCQCGAVRYALYAEPSGAHICHCRMCQKAFGSFFAPLVAIAYADFAWTRGEPGWFASSVTVRRGFCRDCGTPLGVETIGEERLDLSIGSLDEPARLAPQRQVGIESKLPWFSTLDGLPGKTTKGQFESLQHPDHDTKQGSPAE